VTVADNGEDLTQGPAPQEPESTDEQVESNLGEIHILFDMNDQMAVQYNNCKPWKLWAASKMLEMLGDQVFMTGQIARMQQQQAEEQARQQIMQQLSQRGGLKGPRQ
jgi:hypothetical protein